MSGSSQSSKAHGGCLRFLGKICALALLGRAIVCYTLPRVTDSRAVRAVGPRARMRLSSPTTHALPEWRQYQRRRVRAPALTVLESMRIICSHTDLLLLAGSCCVGAVWAVASLLYSLVPIPRRAGMAGGEKLGGMH